MLLYICKEKEQQPEREVERWIFMKKIVKI